MLHCPRNIMRTVAYSGIFLATGFASALAADPTGDWRAANGVANILVAECNGSMWGVVAWEKTPGGRDKNNPDVSKQNRPTLGMPILIDMKKRPSVDQWQGQVYNAKDGQFYSSTIRPIGSDQLEIPRRRPDTLQPRQQHGQRRAKDRGCAPPDHRADDGRRPAEDHRLHQARCQNIRSKAVVGRSGWRHLSTPGHRAVFPLALAGTTTPRRAS